MRRENKIRVIIDTNCWISFLIGRRLSRLVSLISNERILLVVCDELLEEIREVTSRPKFAKYFKAEDVESLIEFLQIIGEHIEPRQSLKLCRDEADDYLLALAIESRASFLVTGDYDLLVIHQVGSCKIVNASAFERLIV